MVTNFDPSTFVFNDTVRNGLLDLFRIGASNIQAAVSLGLTKKQFDGLRELLPEFDDFCTYGEDISIAYLEQLALDGGEGKVKNFNNTVIQFLLKARCPAIYDSKKDDKPEGDSLLEQLSAGSLKLVRDNQ